MSFSIANTSTSAVITDITTPSSVTGELTVTSGSLPLSTGGFIGGTNTTIDNQKGSPYGTIQMFLKQGDAQIDTYVNNTLYSSEKYGSGIAEIQTPILQSGDSLTMSLSDIDATCSDVGTGFNSDPEIFRQQADGKLFVGGFFTTYQGISANRIVRLNTDFSIDTNFDYGSGFNAEVFALQIQSDEKILVAGAFTTYNGVSRNRIVRLNTDGSIDNTFSIGTGFSSAVWAMTLQPDGKILCAGDFLSYSGVAKTRMIRLNTDGSVDNTFITPTINDTVFDIGVQPDGKVVIVGAFTQVSGVTNNRIVRFNTNGTLDNTFVTGGLTNGYGGFAVLCQADGKVVVGGDFTTVSGVASNRIVRFLSGGTRDTSFVIGSGFTQTGGNCQILDISLTQSDKYLVSGQFGSYNGNTSKALARLNSDGSFDSTLNQGAGFTYNISGFSLPSIPLSNGNMVVGGDLSAYDGVSTPAIAVLDPFGKLLNCQ